MKKEFKIDQVVYLKHDPDHTPRMITGITERKAGLSYELASGTISTWHYASEMTTKPDDHIFPKQSAAIGLCQREKK